jgi:hypothetical protein
MHTCNPWCGAGYHAIFFESQQSEAPILEAVSGNMARNAGFEYVGYQVVAPAGLPAVGTPTQFGLILAKVVAWGKSARA